MAPNLRINLIPNGGGWLNFKFQIIKVPDNFMYFPVEYLLASAVQFGKPSMMGNVGSVVS